MIKVTGFSKVKRNLTNLEKDVRKKVRKVLKKTTEELMDRVDSNISLKDHTLFDLAKMGHPYALRNPQIPHEPYYLVHDQGGLLKTSLFNRVSVKEGGGFLGGDIMIGTVGFKEEKCPYVRYVVMGTKKMVSRDVLTGTMNEAKDDLEEMMSKALR